MPGVVLLRGVQRYSVEAEVKLKRTYAEKVGKVLPGTKTVRYIQIENKVRALVSFELARAIPLVY